MVLRLLRTKGVKPNKKFITESPDSNFVDILQVFLSHIKFSPKFALLNESPFFQVRIFSNFLQIKGSRSVHSSITTTTQQTCTVCQSNGIN